MKKFSKAFIVQTVQKALNAYLALDPETKKRLIPLAGKIVAIELLGMGMTIYLVFTTQQLLVKTDVDTKADTIIKGTPLRLLHMTIATNNRQQFFSDDISVYGNAELGQQVMALFDHLEIDWEEHLARWVGDAPAHFIGRVSRQLKTWGQKTRGTLWQNVNEYVHEEVNLFPPREAMQDFFHDVDTLRMDADRVESRIQQLQKAMDDKRGVL